MAEPYSVEAFNEWLGLSDEVLTAMADSCGVEFAVLKKHYLLQKENISKAIFAADIGLRSRSRSVEQEVNRKILANLKTALKNYKACVEMVKNTYSMKEAFETAIYMHDDYIERAAVRDHMLHHPHANLDLFLSICEEAYSNVSKPKGKGRPASLSGLKKYVYEIASLYQNATGKPFTVDEVRSNGQPIAATHGQRFVEIAGQKFNKRYESYTPSNWQTVCVIVAKELRNNKS